jgi:hypothetical protein
MMPVVVSRDSVTAPVNKTLYIQGTVQKQSKSCSVSSYLDAFGYGTSHLVLESVFVLSSLPLVGIHGINLSMKPRAIGDTIGQRV